MKAFSIDNGYMLGDTDSSDIAFGNSAKEALKNYFKGNSVLKTWELSKGKIKKSDITTERMKFLDNYENKPAMLIIEKAIENTDGTFTVADNYYSKSCTVYRDSNDNDIEERFFDKKQFEQDWKNNYSKV